MDVTDPIEATVACRHCQPVHAPAFSGTPDELTRPAYPKKPATEWRDANGANGEDGG